jgi:transcriptional regulator with XRE-family HTH domain
MTTIDEYREGFGKLLRRYRKLTGWNQEALARALSVDRSLISRWESGNREPGLWDVVRTALALGVPVSALVTGSAVPKGGSEVVWLELAYRGAPLLAAGSLPLWSVRPVHETIADVLVHTEPRLIDYLPGLLLLEDFSPRALWGLCADLSVERRLGWIADIALGAAREGWVATHAHQSTALRTVLELVARPGREANVDSLGFVSSDPRRLPPVFKRWRISYDGDLDRFKAAAQELDKARRGGVVL